MVHENLLLTTHSIERNFLLLISFILHPRLLLKSVEQKAAKYFAHHRSLPLLEYTEISFKAFHHNLPNKLEESINFRLLSFNFWQSIYNIHNGMLIIHLETFHVKQHKFVMSPQRLSNRRKICFNFVAKCLPPADDMSNAYKILQFRHCSAKNPKRFLKCVGSKSLLSEKQD